MRNDQIETVFSELKKKGCRFLVLDLPSEFPETTGLLKVRFLVRSEDKRILLEQAVESGWRKKESPEKEGYLYGVEKFLRFILDQVELEFCFQIACRSTLNGSWVPLDRCINYGAIERSVEENGIRLLSPEDRVPYLLANCIYTKKTFTDEDCRLIEEARKKADEKQMREKTGAVFFRFTDKLFSLIDQGEYAGLTDALWRFADY